MSRFLLPVSHLFLISEAEGDIVLLTHMQRFFYISLLVVFYTKECKYWNSWRCFWDLQCLVLALCSLKILNPGCFSVIFVLSSHTGSWHFSYTRTVVLTYRLQLSELCSLDGWVKTSFISLILPEFACSASKLACAQTETQPWNKVECWKSVAVYYTV